MTMVTEEEARAKWCPKIRVIRRTSNDDIDYSETNRGEDDRSDNAHNCIGSACMAWRWDITHEATPEKSPLQAARLASALQPRTFERGFCGAFGRPV